MAVLRSAVRGGDRRPAAYNRGMWDPRFDQVEHRPWALPSGRYAMTMTWSRLLFAHWPLDPAVLRPLVSPALELETIDGAAWVGVVPFRMEHVGLRGLPRPPRLSSFLELNVRTYVTAGGRPGVFFFSLDAANPIAVRIARCWFGLPYFDARMRASDDGGWTAYASERRHRGFPAGELRARFRPAGPAYRSEPGSLEAWLTERYCLYSVDRRGRARRGEIHHVPWPLQPAEAEFAANTVVDAHGFRLPDSPPLLHYVDRIDVAAWNPVLVG